METKGKGTWLAIGGAILAGYEEARARADLVVSLLNRANLRGHVQYARQVDWAGLEVRST